MLRSIVSATAVAAASAKVYFSEDFASSESGF